MYPTATPENRLKKTRAFCIIFFLLPRSFVVFFVVFVAAMINIAHPPVSSKPPLKKCNIARTVGKKFSTCHERDVSCHQKFEKSSKISSKDNNGTGALIATLPLRDHHDDNEKGAKQTGSDCNQNVIEPDSSSFQQLCNMISDLEQNMSIGGASVDMEGTKLKKKNSMEFDTPNNGEDTLPGKYLNQVYNYYVEIIFKY